MRGSLGNVMACSLAALAARGPPALPRAFFAAAYILSGNGFRRWGVPVRRDEPPFAVGREAQTGLIQGLAVPQFTGHLPVPLIERLAIIGIDAQAHFRAAPGPNFREPVGIRERLACDGDDVGLSRNQHGFGLLEVMDSARGDHRRRAIRCAYGGADARGRAEIAAERTLRIGIV